MPDVLNFFRRMNTLADRTYQVGQLQCLLFAPVLPFELSTQVGSNNYTNGALHIYHTRPTKARTIKATKELL